MKSEQPCFDQGYERFLKARRAVEKNEDASVAWSFQI